MCVETDLDTTKAHIAGFVNSLQPTHVNRTKFESWHDISVQHCSTPFSRCHHPLNRMPLCWHVHESHVFVLIRSLMVQWF